LADIVAAQTSTPPVIGQTRLTLPWKLDDPDVLGPIWLAWSSKGIVLLRWAETTDPPYPDVKTYKRLPSVYGKLRDYARGKGVDPTELPVDLRGTAFQVGVWNALRRVPLGKVRTYAGIASDVDNPRASRAVGMANNRNPVSVVVPCHRVVSAGYELGGYGGGLERKRALLTLEGVKFDGDHLLPGQLALFE